MRRTWYGRCIHPKMYVVPERIQAICARANPRSIGGLSLLLLGTGNIALHLFEEPPYSTASCEDFRVRVVERVAAYGQTMGREALHARAEREQPDATRVGVVQRKAGKDGMFPWLWGKGQRRILGHGGGHDRIRRRAAACNGGGLLLLLHDRVHGWLGPRSRRSRPQALRWFPGGTVQ